MEIKKDILKGIFFGLVITTLLISNPNFVPIRTAEEQMDDDPTWEEIRPYFQKGDILWMDGDGWNLFEGLYNDHVVLYIENNPDPLITGDDWFVSAEPPLETSAS